MKQWQTPRPVRAAFFDADGTLLSFATHEVPASTCVALRALREAGVRCFLCTGRSPSLLDDVPLELFDACLTMSGQYCYAGDEVFLSNPIDRDDMRQVVAQVSMKASTIFLPISRVGMEVFLLRSVSQSV